MVSGCLLHIARDCKFENEKVIYDVYSSHFDRRIFFDSYYLSSFMLPSFLEICWFFIWSYLGIFSKFRL